MFRAREIERGAEIQRGAMRILAVDDNRENLYLLETLLKGCGYEVGSATNGAEALEKLHIEGFDMVISDILMPVMDGFQLCMKLKADDRLKAIPFIMYTASYSDEKDEELAWRLGADKFVRKPMEPDKFIKVIDGVAWGSEKGEISSRLKGKREKSAQDEEKEALKLYSERLVSRLERKTLELEREVAERKRLEKALLESEGRYRAIFDNPLNLVNICNEQGVFLDANELAIERLGFTQDDLGKTTIQDIIHTDDLPTALQAMAEVLDKGYMDKAVQMRMVAKSGETIWLDVYASEIEPSEGTRRAMVYGRDITESKRAEESLRESEEKHRLLTEYAVDVIWTMDMSLRTTYVSPSVMRQRGYTVEEAMAQTMEEMMPPSFAEKTRQVLQDEITLERGGQEDPNRQHRLEVMLYCKDESTIWAEINVAFIRNSVGQAIGILGVVRDISERKQAEDEVIEREIELETMLNNARDMIVFSDPAGAAVNINDRVWDTLGYYPAEIIGHSFLEVGVFDPDESSKMSDLFTRSAGGSTVGASLLELEAKHKDGHKVPVEVSTRSIKRADGEIEGFLSIMRNIAERKKAEEELARVKQEKDAQIIQSAKLASLGEMAAGIAHEINQPLNIIKLTTSGLQRLMKKGKTIDQETLVEELNSVDSQIERTRAIINHMRTFARRSADLRSEYVDINVPLRDCFKFVGEQLRLREIETDLDLAELPQVKGDSNKIEQVFLNIIGNARDAMDEFADSQGPDYKKVLKVQSFVEDGKAVVTFTDTGGGVPKEISDRILEPFFTTKDVGKGTGLGLSISYNIVKDFGGNLDFSVDDGVGTTFRVELPMAGSAQE